jgi:hypothetical protein
VRPIGLGVVLAITIAPFLAEARQAGKVYRIGVVHLTPDLSRMEAFRFSRTQPISPQGRAEQNEDSGAVGREGDPHPIHPTERSQRR